MYGAILINTRDDIIIFDDFSFVSLLHASFQALCANIF